MSLEKEKQGLNLKEYQSKLPNKTYALRVGKEVPEGDVNLGYVHTPRVQSDENISLIDTSYTSDNVIPQDQIESMVVANSQGELEYIDVINNGEVQLRPPGNIFPSSKINVTRKFKKGEMRTENALYYKFEINFHYDSRKAIPNDKGKYVTEKYTGQQIELTDENGNLLDDTYKYDIYVTPQAANPRIYSVLIYLHKNTNETETIMVRYNHIDKVVKDENAQSVQRSIEFYTNKDNTITLDKQTRQMLEGGKLRIVNGVSSFDKKPEAEVQKALADANDKEIFAVIPKENGEGYRIIVPQRSESDPRVPRIFSHRVVASYTGSDAQNVKVTVGHITDWCINPNALLKNELEEYSGNWKNIGMPAGGGKLNAKEMIELSLPFGTPTIPSDAKYYIEDDNGNLLYHIKTMTNNPNVDTQVNEIMSKAVEAKANNINQKPWGNAVQENTVIKNNPIRHRCSIIPERHQTKWDFTWEANGQGYTERTTSYTTRWNVCASVVYKKSLYPQTLDLLDKSKWGTLGANINVDKWKYSYVPEMGKNVIEYLENANDLVGFYQKKELIKGSLVDMMNKSDYQFSVKVRLTDPVDDDAIGILFRVRDAQNYYAFIWEKDELATTELKYEYDHGEGVAGKTNGCGRIMMDQYGFGTTYYNPYNQVPTTWKWTSNKNQYLTQRGFGTRHKKIFKATPSSKMPHPDPSKEEMWDGNTRYPTDKTNCSFTDVTDFSTNYNAKGWEYGKDYKITVVVAGSLFRVYISENVGSDELGTLVCQGTDTTHQKGTYGICCLSQRWTYWYDLKMTELFSDTICSEEKEITLMDMNEKKLSNYTVTDMMEPLIKKKAMEQFEGSPYEVLSYNPRSSAGGFALRIGVRDDFLYGKATTTEAGGTVRSEWTTDANGLSVKGTGSVEYHADGHFTIYTNPGVLPTEQVPGDVKAFKWNQLRLTSGENVQISLGPPDKIRVTATPPPVRVIGRPLALEDGFITKADEYKHMQYLFDTGDFEGFFKKLEIPDSVPKDEILLRIERGIVKGLDSEGRATVENAEYRVNYRFRCQKDEFTRMPVDQFQSQLGVNRLRLKSIMKENILDPDIKVDVVAWTTFQELEAVPLFAVKIEEERKIEIQKPKVEHQSMEMDNWYLRVKNGRFLKRYILPYHEVSSAEKPPEIYVSYPQLLGMVQTPESIVEVDFEYNLPEYTNQEFHNKPYTLADKEVPMILNEYTIQTRYAPIVLVSETGKSFIEVYSLRANQKRTLRVSDIDTKKGIIYLHDRIREQDEVYVRYAYQEDWYTYRGYTNDKGFFHLDLNPTQGHRHTIAKNGFHRWIPTNSDIETMKLEEVSNTELLAKQVHIYMEPTVVRYVDHANPARHGTPIPGTMKTKALFHTDEEWWFNPKDYKYNPTMLRLGKVMLQANSTMNENMTILDTRTRGGGLDESLSKEIIRQINKESMYHWDIGYFDGEAYQENGVIIVRVPRSILKSDKNPDGFHETEVQEAVARHKAYGVLPIIEYYEPSKNEREFNIIPNPEFLYSKHIGYYDPVRSKGKYEVKEINLGSGDNFVLQITDNGEYGITIPGHQFKSNQYRLDIKAMKEHSAPVRSAGTVDIFYRDGTKKQIQLTKINRDQWMVYKDFIDIVPGNVHHVTITLNKTAEQRLGSIVYDYVTLIPTPSNDEQTLEIHEI